MNTLVIKDQEFSGKVLNQIALNFEHEYITVKELIASKVEHEVKCQSNTSMNQPFKSLILDMEKILSDLKLKQYISYAIEAFKKNGFVILVDNEQVEKLDQKVFVNETTDVRFYKLIPLVGG